LQDILEINNKITISITGYGFSNQNSSWLAAVAELFA